MISLIDLINLEPGCPRFICLWGQQHRPSFVDLIGFLDAVVWWRPWRSHDALGEHLCHVILRDQRLSSCFHLRHKSEREKQMSRYNTRVLVYPKGQWGNLGQLTLRQGYILHNEYYVRGIYYIMNITSGYILHNEYYVRVHILRNITKLLSSSRREIERERECVCALTYSGIRLRKIMNPD